MSASTILRVKRKLEDNPQDAFVLMCKRVKTDEDDLSSTLFVFQGTVEDQDSIRVKRLSSKCGVKNPSSANDIIQKIRKKHKEISTESRYELVNCSRGLNKCDSSDNNYHLVDLQQKSCQEENTQYAFDLYIAARQDFDISMLDNLVSIENYETDLVFGSQRDNGHQSPSSDCGDENSDDSNNENNWRNEYPDTENSSIDEEDMIKAMERCDLDDLSSDGGEDKIYDEPPDLFSVEDANQYGVEYAKYKARVLSEHPEIDRNSLVHYSAVNNFDEQSSGYKDDSDDGFYYGQEEDTEQFKEQYRLNESSDEYDPD